MRSERRKEVTRQLVADSKGWMAQALPAVIRYLNPREGHFVTGEKLATVAANAAGRPHHPNVFGGLVSLLAERKLLKRTSKWSRLQRQESHSRRTPVWKIA